MDEVTAAVEALESKRRLAQGIVAVHVAVYAVALILFLFDKWELTLALLGVNLLIYFFVARWIRGSYARAATEASLRFGLCSGLEDVTYRAKGGMDRADLEQWAMLPLDGNLLCRHFVTGRERDMVLTCNEAALHYAAAGANGKDVHRFLNGTILTARGKPENRQEDWLLLCRGLLDEGVQEKFLQANGYYAAQGAPEGYSLYAHQPDARLPDYLVRRLTKLCREMKRLGALRLTQDGAAAYLDMRFYTESGYPSARPSADQLRENTLAERDDLWALFRFWFTAGKE